MFVNRERELALLEQQLASDKAALFVLYGRRRVGKTELLRAFCQDKRHIFFVADLGSESGALAEFTRQIGLFVYDDPDLLSPFTTWDAAFNFLLAQMGQERLVVVLDEFTYLIDINAAVPSILQRLWDTRMQETPIMLILCGSYVGMMEQHVLAYRSPLYGRRTGQWRLQPLTFWDAQHLLPGLSPADLVRAYAILGGVPAYLRQFTGSRSLLEEVEQEILTPGRFLYDEPRFLLLQELRDPNRYFAILEAIAGGRTRSNDIAQAAGIASSSLSFYLNTLDEMGLVTRVVPTTERQPHKSKMGLYKLTDHYFRFWFRFVYSNHSLLERGQTSQVRQLVATQLDQFVGYAFEMLCQEYLWRRHESLLGFVPSSVGSWWNRNTEIDVVALSDKSILCGECKWTSKPVGTNVLADLQAKSAAVLKQGRWTKTLYALFARSGFTPELRARAAGGDVLLINLNDILAG